MKVKVAVLFAAGALVCTGAFANVDLAKKSGCLTCHQPDKKVVGPAYQDVAKKYAGQKDAEAKVIESITKGGMGKWGQIPMPPKGGNNAVSDADVKVLAKWILGGAK
jgi:cytochrome c